MEKNKLTKEQIQDCEGLEYLTWSQFDSPDTPGSGYRFMEREPVLILDSITKSTRWEFDIIMGYMSETAANKASLPAKDLHRIGKAIRIRILNPYKRMILIKYLVLHGVESIAVDRQTVYFDTEIFNKPRFRLWY
jgi:hypothetical protein